MRNASPIRPMSELQASSHFFTPRGNNITVAVKKTCGLVARKLPPERCRTEDLMKLSKTASVEELQVISRFESLRKILLSEQYATPEKPLAYWALPTDRRLPLAFLGARLEDLLQRAVLRTVRHARDRTEENVLFCQTAGPGGQHRPLRTADRPDRTCPTRRVRQQRRRGARRRLQPGHGFGSRLEPMAGERGKHGLGHEMLGRFAPSLRNMTRVIWNTPAGGLHQLRPGRNPRHEDPRRETGPRHPRSLPQPARPGGQHGHPGAPGRADRPAADRRRRALDRAGAANAGRARPGRKSSSTSSARCWNKSASTPPSRSPAWRKIAWGSRRPSPACGRPRGPWA